MARIVVLDGYTLNPGDLSWASLAARRRLLNAVVANVKAFLNGETLNVVNGV